jgi:hypothetical protein
MLTVELYYFPPTRCCRCRLPPSHRTHTEPGLAGTLFSPVKRQRALLLLLLQFSLPHAAASAPSAASRIFHNQTLHLLKGGEM